MGVVVAAQHLALDKRVAIKLMRPQLRIRRDLVRRFVREARAAARLTSRHIAHVFDVGTLDDGAPYIVMEYLEGTDLATWVRQHGPASVPLAAAMVLQASSAIAEAHAIGIVHRDLKPANLFVTRDSHGESLVKVLDLGICKLVERTDERLDTTPHGVLGTPAYAAPEQLETPQRADTRSDIWSLGVILYELVTGRVPFQGHTQAELLACASRDPYPPIHGVTTEFETIVARCLAKDPAARFQAVAELVTALAPFAQDTAAVAGGISPRTRASLRKPRRWTLSASIVAAFAILGASALGSSLRAASGSAVKRAEAPPPTRSPDLGSAPSQPMPMLRPSALTSAQLAPAPQREEMGRSHVEPAPAASAPARSMSTIAGARTARARHNSLHPSVAASAVPEPTPPRASVDPLGTSY